MKTFIKNAWVLTFDETWSEFAGGYVLIEDDKISAVGNDPALCAAYEQTSDEVKDADGRWVLPGMINAHSHMFQTFQRGLADDKSLRQWLFEEIYPFCEVMEEEDFYLSALVGCLENLKNGATSVIDQHYVHTSPYNADKTLEAMKLSGIRGAYCRTISNRLPFRALNEYREQIFAEMDRLHYLWHGAENGRLTVMLGPMNPWGSDYTLIGECYAYAEEKNILMQIHTAENEEVVQRSVDEYGLRNVTFLNKIGALGKRTQLAHAVCVTDDEISLIKSRKATVIHNPVANMYLASGVAPIPKFLKMKIPVALATDGPGSNNSQDMFEILKATACLHKVNSKDAKILYSEDVLRMATKGGAATFGRNDLGMIKEGYQADLLIMSWKKPHIAPVHKANSALVYNANGNDVDCVYVAGKLCVDEKKALCVDEQALLSQCQERALYLRKKVTEKRFRREPSPE